jgi:hypothetical protein
MTPEQQALHDLMPVIDKIIEAGKYGANADWDNVNWTLLNAADLFMYITKDKDSLIMSLYKEWLKCQKEPKSPKPNARSKPLPAKKD